MPGVLRRLVFAIIVVGVFTLILISSCGDDDVSEVDTSTTTTTGEALTLDKTKLTEQVTVAVSTPVARIVPRRKVAARPSVTVVPKPVQPAGERRVFHVPWPLTKIGRA